MFGGSSASKKDFYTTVLDFLYNLVVAKDPLPIFHFSTLILCWSCVRFVRRIKNVNSKCCVSD